jgi:hypothetical protein
MHLQGKGMYLWKISQAEGGDPAAIAHAAEQAGLTHVLLKIADGNYPYNVDLSTGKDLVWPVVQSLRSRGIEVWGWHYVYGYEPVKEADVAIARIRSLDLAGYVIDAEAEYKQPGKEVAARQFMARLRSALPTYPIALSSYRYPSYHPQFPWKPFLEKVDLNMPQVYWLLSHNPGDQLARSVQEFQSMTPYRPVIPTGAAFKQGSWSPTEADILDFFQTAQRLNLSAANFWEWTNCRLHPPGIWKVMSEFQWKTPAVVEDIVKQYVNALNSREPGKVAALYQPTAVHVTYARTVQGIQSIADWYRSFFQRLPEVSVVLSSSSGVGNTRQFNWTAHSKAGRVLNGSDTIGLSNGRILYHFSKFNVT